MAVAQQVDSLTGEVRTVHITGKRHTFEESLPIISAMLKSQDKKQREEAMGAAQYWGHDLKNSAIVTQLIDHFPKEKDYELRIELLRTLCTISDRRAVGVFRQAAASSDMMLRVGGAVGLADHEPTEAVPMLLDRMLETWNPMLVNAAYMTIQELAHFSAPKPPFSAWMFPITKKKYREEFLQWWHANKDRLITEWKAKHPSEQEVKSPEAATAVHTTAPAPGAAPELPKPPTQK